MHRAKPDVFGDLLIIALHDLIDGVSSTTTSHRFSARFAQLPKLLAAVGAACETAGLSHTARQRVELVFEETFANSIHHGYLGEGDNPVWIRTTMLPDGLRFVYQDAAPPFNPLQCATLPEPGQIGGVGCVLIRNLPRHVEYAQIDQRNTLSFDFDQRD